MVYASSMRQFKFYSWFFLHNHDMVSFFPVIILQFHSNIYIKTEKVLRNVRGKLILWFEFFLGQPNVSHQIEAKNSWTISLNFINWLGRNNYDNFLIVSSSSSLTSPIMNERLYNYNDLPIEIDSLYPGTEYYLHFTRLSQHCPGGEQPFNYTTSACTSTLHQFEKKTLLSLKESLLL